MTEFTDETFTSTTADDQAKNYFFGAVQEEQASLGEGRGLPPGTYRIVDGALCRIISGLPVQDVRSRILQAYGPDS